MGSQPPPCGPECGPSGCDVKKQPETPKDKNPSRINDLGFPGGITWDVRRRPGTASHVVDHFPIGRRTRLRGIAPAPSRSRSRSRIGGIHVSMAPPYLAPAVRSAYHSSMCASGCSARQSRTRRSSNASARRESSPQLTDFELASSALPGSPSSTGGLSVVRLSHCCPHQHLPSESMMQTPLPQHRRSSVMRCSIQTRSS